jgi:hypothetical protein
MMEYSFDFGLADDATTRMVVGLNTQSWRGEYALMLGAEEDEVPCV